MDYYGVASGVPTSGAISLSDFYGKSNAGGACPTGDVPILLPDGTTVLAEEVTVNLVVVSEDLAGLDPSQESAYENYSRDSLDGSSVAQTTVTSVTPVLVQNICRVTTDFTEIKVTGDHPFLVFDGSLYRFKTARELSLDDSLVTHELVLTPVRQVKRVPGEVTVYRISCEPYDLYVHSGLIGHNSKPVT